MSRHDFQFDAGQMVPGTKIRIIRPLGYGGMGEVYECEETFTELRYVLKIIRPELVGGKKMLARMEQEAKVLGKLRHPNIVQVFWAGITDGSAKLFYYVMEKLEGHSLRRAARKAAERNTFLGLDSVLEIMINLLHALAHAHAQGIVHRDVKPDNIFLHRTDGGIVTKLLDFGIVVEQGKRRTTSHGFVGTLEYAAPELVTGGPVTPAADLYAVGVVLYELVTGRGPFVEATTNFALAQAHLSSAPPPPAQFRSDLPKALEELILRLLAKDVGKRPTDALAVAAELDKIRSDLSEGPSEAIDLSDSDAVADMGPPVMSNIEDTEDDEEPPSSDSQVDMLPVRQGHLPPELDPSRITALASSGGGSPRTPTEILTGGAPTRSTPRGEGQGLAALRSLVAGSALGHSAARSPGALGHSAARSPGALSHAPHATAEKAKKDSTPRVRILRASQVATTIETGPPLGMLAPTSPGENVLAVPSSGSSEPPVTPTQPSAGEVSRGAPSRRQGEAVRQPPRPTSSPSSASPPSPPPTRSARFPFAADAPAVANSDQEMARQRAPGLTPAIDSDPTTPDVNAREQIAVDNAWKASAPLDPVSNLYAEQQPMVGQIESRLESWFQAPAHPEVAHSVENPLVPLHYPPGDRVPVGAAGTGVLSTGTPASISAIPRLPAPGWRRPAVAFAVSLIGAFFLLGTSGALWMRFRGARTAGQVTAVSASIVAASRLPPTASAAPEIALQKQSPGPHSAVSRDEPKASPEPRGPIGQLPSATVAIAPSGVYEAESATSEIAPSEAALEAAPSSAPRRSGTARQHARAAANTAAEAVAPTVAAAPPVPSSTPPVPLAPAAAEATQPRKIELPFQTSEIFGDNLPGSSSNDLGATPSRDKASGPGESTNGSPKAAKKGTRK